MRPAPPVNNPIMPLRLFQVDAFASRPFTGNPAAVVPLRTWLPDATLQAIAMENNLSETAFLVPHDEADFHLRWFTPALEVNLCGHATLATTHVLMDHCGWEADTVTYHCRSGKLSVERTGDIYTLDFPAYALEAIDAPAGLAEALGAAPTEVHRGTHLFAVFERESDVRALRPDFKALGAMQPGYIIATAPGDDHDFVSRFFAPGAGIDEDPVTGSAHCTSAPYWAQRLNKTTLAARQISQRGGDLICTHSPGSGRVGIAGRAITILEGTYTLDL